MSSRGMNTHGSTTTPLLLTTLQVVSCGYNCVKLCGLDIFLPKNEY